LKTATADPPPRTRSGRIGGMLSFSGAGTLLERCGAFGGGVMARLSLLWACLGVILVGSAAAIWFAWSCPAALLGPRPPDTGAAPWAACVDLRKTVVTEGVKLVLQLAVIGVLGGLAKLVLDAWAVSRQEARAKREASRDQLQGYVTRLREASAALAVARVAAGEERQPLILAAAAALDGLDGLVKEVARSKRLAGTGQVVQALNPARVFLRGAVEEWKREEPKTRLAVQAGRSEAVAQHLEVHAPTLQHLIREDEVYRRQFVEPLEEASALINDAIGEGT
jgi:hypothetical protein